MVAPGGEGDLAELVERETSGPAILRVPRSGVPALTSATALATSAEAMGWTRVAGRRTEFSSASEVSIEAMNSKN